MIQTKAIVLSAIKFQETSLIVRCYTLEGVLYYLLKDLKASELTMLLSSIPGFTYVLGVLFGVLSFSWLRFFGVLVVTLGGVMFNVSPGASFGGVQGIAFSFL